MYNQISVLPFPIAIGSRFSSTLRMMTIVCLTVNVCLSVQLKSEIASKAVKRTNRLTWLGLGLMGLQFGLLARLTWWEYSWDIMEPVTYFVGYGSAIAMFGYYILTKQVLALLSAVHLYVVYV